MTSSRGHHHLGEPSQFTALCDASAACAATSQSLTKRRQTLPAYSDDCERVQKYKDHFSFLRNSKFLQDLENDSVDSDIIEEELSALQEVPISTREKVAKFLQSNPVQILLCVIVLLDAGIVIAQILLDLNSVKDKLHRRDVQLSSLLKYIKETHPARLHGYTGEDVDLILRMLRDESHSTDDGLSSRRSNSTVAAAAIQDSINRTQAKWSGSVAHESAATGRDGNTSTILGDFRYVEQDEHDLLHEVAHGLHFASIALLGFLVIEDLIKIIAMGRTFFKHKIEIFDAVIIVSSFAIDIVFLGGVSGEEGQKAAAVLVILLLWRIARVVDGIVVTVKQRQEFRIRLQKRARRMAEKKLESFEEERHSKTRQIEALKDLCTKAGITDADIAACAPVDPKRVNTTLCALSSVARLSVSMTMLMSSGVYRPRLLDERIVLPKMFNPRPKEPAAAAAAVQRRGVLPRIESLPIMKNSYMPSSASKKQQRRHRKSASGKIYRKKDKEAEEEGGGGARSKNLPSPSAIETTEDCSHVTIESTTSSGASGPEMDRNRLTESPVNRSGVHIVIDGGSDAETDLFPVTEAENDNSSPPNIVGPRHDSTDTDPLDQNVRPSHSTRVDNGTEPANGATSGFSHGFTEPCQDVESNVGSSDCIVAGMFPITNLEPEASHGSTLGSKPNCKSSTNHAEAPGSCKSSRSGF